MATSKCGSFRWPIPAVIVVASLAGPLNAQFIPIYGPRPATAGVEFDAFLAPHVNRFGVAAGSTLPIQAGVGHGTFGVTWRDSPFPATVLQDLGLDYLGGTETTVLGLNDAGTAVGSITKYTPGPDYFDNGIAAVRWDTATGSATELQYLGVFNPDLAGYAEAFAINNQGTTVGTAMQFDENGFQVSYPLAVAWPAGSNVPQKLGALANGLSEVSEANAISDNGTIVGFASYFDESGQTQGFNAVVRWDSGGSPTRLNDLGRGATPVAVNNAGAAVGIATKILGPDEWSDVPVIWNPLSTAAVELPTLGTGSHASGYVYDINNAGTSVGHSGKYDNEGTPIGIRPMRWSGNVAEELPILSSDPSAYSDSEALDINNFGEAVGYSSECDEFDCAEQAVMWRADGSIVNLNSLIDPNSGWGLHRATSISDTGWITGVGRDGSNIYAQHTFFLIHVPFDPVLPGDFNGDGLWTADDINRLVAELANATANLNYDVNGDGILNFSDLNAWLVVAGTNNLPSGNPYMFGDANLDGNVDNQDFLAWNANKFMSVAAWTAGDFNADGSVDGQDFLAWNNNKFQSSDRLGTTVVPEPSEWMIICLAGGLLLWPRGSKSAVTSIHWARGSSTRR